MNSRFLDSVDAVASTHGDRLRNLVGRVLTGVKIVWDTDDQSWFADEPVLLLFDDLQLEIVFWQLNELALNWNAINLSTKPNWFGCYDDMSLEWRDCAAPAAAAAIGETVSGVTLVEYYYETEVLQDRQNPANVGNRYGTWLLHALQLRFSELVLTVYNALDENAISSEPLDGDGYRHTQFTAA